MPGPEKLHTLLPAAARRVANNRRRVGQALVVCATLACRMLAAAPEARTLYGHRAYAVAKKSQVVVVGKYRSSRTVKLLPSAAAAFRKMQAAAQLQGVGITPISGYRGFDLQKYLFDKKVKKLGRPELAARWVAPPGYSEHHTGLALDVGDPSTPKCDALPCFEKTRTYHWLTKNAARFGFELSFHEAEGHIQFEPWHWRFVGDAEGQKLFHNP